MEQLSKLLNKSVMSFGGGLQLTVSQVLLALLIVGLGIWLARWSEKKLSLRLVQRRMNADVVQLIRRTFYIVVMIVLIFTALDLLNVPLTAFAFVTGAIAIGVGFGAQNIINNFISGWILMWERPIRIDDLLEMGDMIGTVEAINTRSTRIKRTDGVRVLIPNSHLLENTVVNWTIVDKIVRSSVRVGVQYGSDVEKVRDTLIQLAEQQPDILHDPAPRVYFEDFGDSALMFELMFWMETGTERGLRVMRSDLRFEINRVFRDLGIVIAYPQRDVHVDGALLLTRENIKESDD